ncbi:ABC transporter substrate-binding protein [Geodermatophilus sp. URMC 64]
MKSSRVLAAGSALSLSIALAACGGSDAGGSGGSSIETASAGEPVTLQVACANGFEHLPRFEAEKQGYDDEQNLTTECVQVNTGPEQSAALLSGDLDVAIMNAANLAPLLDQGQDLVAFGALRSATYWDLLVDKDYDLPNAGDGWEGVVKDLEGARFGVVARGAAAETIATAMFKAAGVDPASVTFIATGLPNTTLAALDGNTVDAALVFEPGVTLAVDQGIATNPFSLQAGEGPEELDHPDMMLVTSRANAEQSADALCRLTQSWDQGLEYVHDESNHDAVVADTAELLSLDDNVAADVVDRDVDFLAESTALDDAGMDKAFKLLADNGSAKKAYTTDDYAVEVC